MAKRDLSNHQRKIVNRYYEHRDTIALEKLSTIVTDLYLADSQKKQDALWKRAATHLKNAGAKPADIEKLTDSRDVEALAKLVQRLH